MSPNSADRRKLLASHIADDNDVIRYLTWRDSYIFFRRHMYIRDVSLHNISEGSYGRIKEHLNLVLCANKGALTYMDAETAEIMLRKLNGRILSLIEACPKKKTLAERQATLAQIQEAYRQWTALDGYLYDHRLDIILNEDDREAGRERRTGNIRDLSSTLVEYALF